MAECRVIKAVMTTWAACEICAQQIDPCLSWADSWLPEQLLMAHSKADMPHEAVTDHK